MLDTLDTDGMSTREIFLLASLFLSVSLDPTTRAREVLENNYLDPLLDLHVFQLMVGNGIADAVTLLGTRKPASCVH